MAIVTSYYSASGPSFKDCAFLAQRYDSDAGYHPNEAECWVCTVAGGAGGGVELQLQLGSTSWLTQLWRSDSGAVYVSSADGTVRMCPDPRVAGAAWDKPTLDAALFGIWGLDDRFVLAWGLRGTTPVMFRWDGKAWGEIPAPPFGVRSVHGTARDLVYAAGTDGGVARWDGATWRRLATPTREILASVFVAGPDEVYAVGNEGGVFEGSAAGWGKIGEGPGLPGPLAAVAKYKGELWIGAWRLGLFRRSGNTSRFDVVKPNLHAVSFDARWSLVVACEDRVSGTEDGQSFFSSAKEFVLTQRANHPLCDF